MPTVPWTNCYTPAAAASRPSGARAKFVAPSPQILQSQIGKVGSHYFCWIGGAIFSAGADGSTGWAPAFCASASGRAGSGGTPDGRLPVVAGSDGADGLLSAPGVGCSGGVACARRCRSVALHSLRANPDI